MPVLLSFGHGYSAQALTRILPDEWTVYGTTRSVEKFDAVEASGAKPILWPASEIDSILAQSTHLLLSAAPSEDGDPVLLELGDAVARHAPNLEWVGYLSTTGVYGDHQGDWVDECTELTPSTKRGQLRKDAEAAWSAIPNLPLHIFRLAGIYGPGRGPFAKVRAGTARRIIKKNQVFSRIHVEDIAQVLMASIQKPRAGAIYNLCDNDPAPPQDVIGYAAKLLGLPLPEAVDFETAEMSPMARSFYAESKKVRNDLIQDELGVELLYPTYKAGLRALVSQEGY
ncbi:SDR family oxidoreductase [Algirhabdus cladophorae]|uniref:SDR family oxidoreductase n=1 Tax=Algirhabdus cladophorae TaxID=3377108 RepID=UPI003B849FE2